ncbi:MAG: thioesterase family protein [Sporomusaceae bacterium]|nr:thioesterase family protein [Sporomusaceae bacterium]
MEYNLSLGLSNEKQEKVTTDNTAIRYGSGGAAVYATPAMIGLMEATALSIVDPRLPAGLATVGIQLNVRHLAATPIGMTVRCTAKLTEIKGKRLIFSVEAFDEKEKVGEGTHERYIIELESFLKKSQSKLN